MLQDEKIIALNLRSRPLRLAYLVTCLNDLNNAVNLYTHTWGGAANILLPVYDDEDEIKQLHNSLIKFDPDYILSTHGIDLPQEVTDILENYPARHYSIRQEKIKKFVDCEDKIDLHVGNLSSGSNAKLPHIASVLKDLHPNPVSESGIYLLESLSSEFDLNLVLQAGITSQSYCEDLIQHLGAKILTTPKNPENLFKTSLSLSTSLNPVLLTLENTKKQYRGELSGSERFDAPSALCLFLYEEGDLDIATSFWNARWFYPSNKLVFPKQEFFDNVEDYVNLALSAIPSLKAIYLAANINSRDEAQNLQNNIKDRLSKVVGRVFSVWLSYSNFYEEVRKVSIYSSSPKISSQKMHSDDSIRFLPETPSGLENSNFAFGYDAELNLEAGNKLLFPRS